MRRHRSSPIPRSKLLPWEHRVPSWASLVLPWRRLLLPWKRLVLPWACLALVTGCDKGDGAVTVAVASNFVSTHDALAGAFHDWTGLQVRTVVGSTGQLYAQIRSGAPVDVFLAADEERPRRLEEEGLAVQGSRFTYAVGRLALYGAESSRPVPSLEEIQAAAHDGLLDPANARVVSGDAEVALADVRVALADARVAPYGRAAEAVLGRLGLTDALEARVVRGESVGQVHRFVLSGAAEWGLVALTQVVDEPVGAWRLVPDSLHAPIRQEAVLLRRAAADPAALAWMDFLRSTEARRLIREHGYESPGGGG